MELIVDTNKIIATLLKSGKVRALFYSGIKLIVLRYSIDEIVSNEKLIRRFGKEFLTKAFEFFVVKNPNVILVDHSDIDKNSRELAMEIANQFDPKDAPFIALALQLNIPIWTNDKKIIEHSLKSGKYLALDTQAVEELIQGKNLEKIKQKLKEKYSN
jgi:predicted nucleic acid-binding protein